MFTMLGEVSGYRDSSWPAKTVLVRQKPNPVNLVNLVNPAHDFHDVNPVVKVSHAACTDTLGASET